MCNPVIPFPAIGDAAYRQHAAGGPSHGYRQHAQKFAKDRECGSEDMLADRQTDTHTHKPANFVNSALHPSGVAKSSTSFGCMG